MKRLILLTILLVGAVSFSFAQTQYYSQDFEAGFPAEWTMDGEWAWGNAVQTQSSYFDLSTNTTNFIVFNDDGAGSGHVGGGRVVTDAIDLSAASGTLFMEVDIQFLNADYQGADEVAKILISTDGGTTWTDLIDFGAVGTWSTQIIQMDSYAGQTVNLAFDYQDGAGWNFGYGVDNISFSDVPINTPRRAWAMTINGGSQFTEAISGLDYPVQGLFINSGWETVTSFDVNVSLNGMIIGTQTIDGVSVERTGAVRYELDDTIEIPDGFTTYSVSVSNVNGDATDDEDVSDNAKNLIFNTTQTGNVHPEKAVLVEEATGTWCQWCPRGTVYLDEMSKRFGDNFVGVAVHNSDPMVLGSYDTAIGNFPGFQGYPSVLYNRRQILDPSTIVSPSIQDMSTAPIAAITVGAAEDGPILTTSVEVNFMQDVTDNYRVAVILTEDGLVGDGSAAWGQVNAYSGGAQGPMGGFELLGTRVPAEYWPYDHVGRALVGNFTGVGNSITGTFAPGDVGSHIFDDIIIPATWNKDKLHVIGVLINGAGSITNVSSAKYEEAVARGLSTSVEDELDYSFLDVYPNPVADQATVRVALVDAKTVNVTLINSLGQKVSSQSYGKISGNQELQYNMEGVNSGVYFMNIQIDDQVYTQRITKS